MKTVLKVVVGLIVLVLLIGFGGVYYLQRGLDKGSEVMINNVNLASISDGTYTGQYNEGRWSNKVTVVVKDHQITDINIDKKILFEKPEVTEELLTKVINQQNINVDVVAGATVTCKAYLKAIEDALTTLN